MSRFGFHRIQSNTFVHQLRSIYNSPSSGQDATASSSSAHKLSRQQRLKEDGDEPYDIVINGGGIVGLTFLLALQKSSFMSNKRTLLIERQKPPSSASSPAQSSTSPPAPNRQFSNRVSSLTEASKQLLDQLGVWPDLRPLAKEVEQMYVWSHDYNRAIRFENEQQTQHQMTDDAALSSNPFGHLLRQPVCYIAENRHILQLLNRELDHSHIAYECDVQQIAPANNLVQLTIGSGSGSKQASSTDKETNQQEEQAGSLIRTKLLIGCDGFNSFVRSKASFEQPFGYKLGQMGIVGTVRMDANSISSRNSISYQRFLPSVDSVIALLPLDNEHCSFVLSTRQSMCEKLMKTSDEQFVDYLNSFLLADERFTGEGQPWLNALTEQLDILSRAILPKKLTEQASYATAPRVASLQSGSRAAFPLGFSTTLPNLVSTVIGSSFINVALIGDSAHRVHPLAGQGLNLGIGDAAQLAETLEQALSRGEPLFGHPDDPLQSESLQAALLAFERERAPKLISMIAAIQSMQETFRYSSPMMLHLFNQLDLIKHQLVKFANAR